MFSGSSNPIELLRIVFHLTGSGQDEKFEGNAELLIRSVLRWNSYVQRRGQIHQRRVTYANQYEASHTDG